MAAGRPTPSRRQASRRRKLLTRSAPIVVIATAAFAAGARLATAPGREQRQVVTRYVADWARGDVIGMYALLDRASRARVAEPVFARMLRAPAEIATVGSLGVGNVESVGGGGARVAMTVHTRLWGALHETLALPMTGSGSGARVQLRESMLFPGLRAGETLARKVRLGTRGTLEAADGTPLAQGPARTSPIPAVAGQVVGTLGAIPAQRAAHYAVLGYPATAKVGLDGLELVFQNRLAGRPGGELLAGDRVLARTQPRPGVTVRTTIVPRLEQAAVDALAGRYAGMIVMNPRTGGVEAADGLAYDAPQPPGSTFKIITSTGLLGAHLATLSSVYPVATQAVIGGYTLRNAANEACGGTLLNAFAVSCNSTFAPLGVKLGARRLVALARRFGFDQKPPFAGALPSTIPSAARIGGPVAVGSSAIGQGRVLATPLEMVDVTAAIAEHGRRPVPSYLAGTTHWVHVTTPAVAAGVQKMMVAVMQIGTGQAASIPGVEVAGKTGTAELVDTSSTAASANPKNTDSWFVAYAPVGDPRVAVAALFPGAGYGAATAGPAVRSAIEAALQG